MLSRGVVSFCAGVAAIAARTSRSTVESAVGFDCGVERSGHPRSTESPPPAPRRR